MGVFLTGTDTDGVSATGILDTWITLEGEVVANTSTAFNFGTHGSNTYIVRGTVVSSILYGISSSISNPGNNNSVTVSESGFVQGRANAILLSGDGNGVVNNGEIVSRGDDAVALTGDFAKVENYGLLSGNTGGLDINGRSASVFNAGEIRGKATAGATFDSDFGEFRNDGVISGKRGVLIEGDNVVLYNSGVIRADYDGVQTGFGTGETITIYNSGLIEVVSQDPENRAVEGGTSMELVINTGRITGDVALFGGNDRYTAINGTLEGELSLGSGDDVAILGDGALTGRQVIRGGNGIDRLDLSAFSSAIWVDLDHSNTQVWTRDGNTLAVSAGTWRKLIDLDEVEDIVGTVGLDLMRGDGADNTFGYVGTSLIDGIEQIDGRGGSDTVDFSRADFAVWVDLNLVANHAYTQDDANATDAPTTSNPWRKIANLQNVENLVGTKQVDFLAGTDGDNTFVYEGSIAYAGIEQINGRGGVDTADFSRFPRAVWVDLASAGTQAWTQDDFDARTGSSGTWRKIAALQEIENINGSTHSDELRGDGGANVIDGGGGNDLLTGRAGADAFIFAGDFGNDRITDFDTNDAEKIDLSDAAGITDFFDLVSNHATLNIDLELVITDDNGNSITLPGYNLTDLGLDISANDFIF